jgi:hypothetical protein
LAPGESFVHFVAGDLNGLGSGARETLEDAGYHSAYPEGTVTAHNDAYHWCGELDFIWHGVCEGESNGNKVKAVLQRILAPPVHERLTPTRSAAHPSSSLPGANWPSDHVSITAEYLLTK